MTNRNNNYDNNSIKTNIFGFSGNLLIGVNAFWSSNIVVVYSFSTADIKSDDDVKHLLFGRVCTNNAFKADKACINNLSRFYSEKLIDFVTTIEELDKVCDECNCNYGIALEKLLVKSGLFKHGTKKQDNKGIDLIGSTNRKLYQLKTSVVKTGSHGSAGTTNKKAHK